MNRFRALIVGSVLLGGCQVMLAAEAARFTQDQLKLPGKKGACFTMPLSADKQGRTIDPRVRALDASWNYSWGPEYVRDQPANMEFVPMIWGAWGSEGLKKCLDQVVSPAVKTGQIKRLLAFNEPDKKDQANMSYTNALEYWPALEKLGIPLCSPACANPEGLNDDSVQGVPGTWMRDFMKEADARGYRVDYIGAHWYGGTSAESFKVKMRRVYEKYGKRPLLITEFAPADWDTGKDIKKNRHSPANVLKFMKEILPWMEEQDWILGYAWFSFNIDSPQGWSSALFDKEGNLTACGRYYKSVTPKNHKGDQTIAPDPKR
jgi:hypothetical protein